MNLLENKINVIQFLTKELMAEHQELIVTNRCQNSEIVLSSLANRVEDLFCSPEEADTKLILHAATAAQNNYH